ncbi:MAG TPA: glycosyltransferase family 4 protein, partial [Stellaceae bacterium]|nr:glycosyltransferase family 4 protein [Stellaceae bacterium]
MLLTTPAAIEPAAPPFGGPPPKLCFLVTEDWYFCSHRLPVARAARDAGFEVLVATRVRDHGDAIRDEGFRLCSLPWRRRGDGPLGAARALGAIAALYRRERPDLVHHVALKPVLFGGLALRLAFPHGTSRPASIVAITGFGSEFAASSGSARAKRAVLGRALRRLAGDRIIVQNPEDGAALAAAGVAPARLALIRGSGVDTGHFVPLPDPDGPEVTVALVARMLRSKGVLDAVAAVRRLRDSGLAVGLLLVGPTDPDNRDSLGERDLARIAASPGIRWLGRVADVREVWVRAAIAVLPSTYGEGVPKALIEAAACARPIVTADMPGCRDIVRHGVTGLLAPPGDTAALAAGLARLAADPAERRAMGLAGRALVEREFGEERVARDTLALYQAV